ncbi:MAG: hypothetical protein J6K62_05845 [Clostridia bacterium]|nr:hypothetical protein [Clostridia bacterium]
MNRLQRLSAPLWAFVLTVSILLAAGGAVRVEYVSHRALHGGTVSLDIGALHGAVDDAADTAERVLPKRITVAIDAFRYAVDIIASWLTSE